jgi:hypothetical protein
MKCVLGFVILGMLCGGGKAILANSYTFIVGSATQTPRALSLMLIGVGLL